MKNTKKHLLALTGILVFAIVTFSLMKNNKENTFHSISAEEIILCQDQVSTRTKLIYKEANQMEIHDTSAENSPTKVDSTPKKSSRVQLTSDNVKRLILAQKQNKH